MERLNHRLHRELSREFDVTLCGPRGADRYLEEDEAFYGCPATPVGAFLACAQFKFPAVALARAPDLIFAGSGLTSLCARTARALTGAPYLTYVHGLDVVTDHPLYRRLFFPAIRSADAVIANSGNTRSLALAAGVSVSRIEVLHPGTDLPGNAIQDQRRAFRDRIGLPGRKLMLSVGRLTPRKGLLEFVERSLPAIVRLLPEVVLVVIGGEARDSAGGGGVGMRDRVEDGARRAGVSDHLLMLGTVDESALAEAYRGSDVLVFPVLDLPGDVEGFGMVAIEAAAHGLPTVAFAVGGVPDAVAEGRSGRLVSQGDYSAFANAIVQVLRGETDISTSSCVAFAEKFSWMHFGERLRTIVRASLDRRR